MKPQNQEFTIMNLKVKALSPKIGKEIPAPFYASVGAAAMDLHACVDEPVTIPAGGRAVIPTGIAIALHRLYDIHRILILFKNPPL